MTYWKQEDGPPPILCPVQNLSNEAASRWIKLHNPDEITCLEAALWKYWPSKNKLREATIEVTTLIPHLLD